MLSLERLCLQKKYSGPKFPGFQPSIVSLFVETVSMGWLEDSGKQYIDLSLIKESLPLFLSLYSLLILHFGQPQPPKWRPPTLP